MSRIPRIVTRITNHRTPKYQFYFPGFNAGNSCWLHGGWVTVSQEEFEKNGAAHQEKWGGVADLARKQHHRDTATPLDKMTPMQRRAWEQYSGTRFVTARNKRDGRETPLSVDTAGGEITDKSLRWMDRYGYEMIKDSYSFKKVSEKS